MMSEAVEKSSIPPEEQRMERDMRDEMVQEKTTTKTSGTELKKDDDAFVKEGERHEVRTAKREDQKEKESTVTTPSTNQEMATTMESDKEKILTAAPSIKIEPGIISDSAGDSQGKISQVDPIKLENETAPDSIHEETAVPALSKGSTDENALVPKEKVPEDGTVEGTMKTDTIGAVKESLREQEEPMVGNGKPSPNVELSGSTTESMDTTSKDSPPSCSSVELMTTDRANNETKTDIVPISEIKKETLSMTETPAVKETPKESVLRSDTQMATLAEACVVNDKDQMEIDDETKPVTDISKDNVQKEETSKQGDLQTAHISSDSSVQNKCTYDANGVQKQETELIKGSMQHKDSVTVDVVQKKEVLPQMVVEQSKAVHEIIAEQSSRLDRERLVPTSVPLDRQSLVPKSVPPVGENLIQTSVPPVAENIVPTSSVSSSGGIGVPMAIASGLENLVPMPAPSVVENLVPTSSVSSSGGIGVPTAVPSVCENLVPQLVPSERESLVPAPVPYETSEPEPVTRPESTVPATPDPKPVVQEALDDWDIPASDEEEDEGDSQAVPSGDGVEKKKRKVVKRGYWEPPIDVIVELYNKLDKEGILELEWKCPGRRPPSEEGDKEEEREQLDDVEDEEAMEISQEDDPTEFDFDMDVDLDTSVKKMTPRRNIGTGQAQGSGKKRVARMDKVLNDIFRHRKIDSTMVDPKKKDEEGKDPTEQTMDTSTSPILTPTRPADKFHIRSDLNM